ncbi:hypothetical protein FO519_008707 [Halicephalobus sp. NKZ332]|nr:hypothetical protein FO519_008707 [Halicephalobus sp. NKZ332]
MSEEDGIELSNVTWPRSRIPAKVLSDIQTRSRIQATLANLKLKSNNDPDTLKLIENLTELLSKVDDETNTAIQSPSQTVNSKAGAGFLKRIRRSTLRNEPYFDSMVTVLQSPPLTVGGKHGEPIRYLDGIRASQDFDNRLFQSPTQTPSQVFDMDELEDYPKI